MPFGGKTFFFYIGAAYPISAYSTLVFIAATGLSRLPAPRGILVVRTILLSVFWLISTLIASVYLEEFASLLPGANPFERYLFIHGRLFGPYACWYWGMLICYLTPQFLWVRRFRQPPIVFFVVLVAALPVIVPAVTGRKL